FPAQLVFSRDIQLLGGRGCRYADLHDVAVQQVGPQIEIDIYGGVTATDAATQCVRHGGGKGHLLPVRMLVVCQVIGERNTKLVVRRWLLGSAHACIDRSITRVWTGNSTVALRRRNGIGRFANHVEPQVRLPRVAGPLVKKETAVVLNSYRAVGPNSKTTTCDLFGGTRARSIGPNVNAASHRER